MQGPGLITLTLKNLQQRPFRKSILALCVAAVVGLLVTSQIIDRSSKNNVQTSMARLGADLVAVPRGVSSAALQAINRGDVSTFYMHKSLESQIRSFSFVEKTSPQLYIKSISGGTCCSVWSTYLIGFDPATDFTVMAWFARNRELKLGPDDILIGAAVQSSPGSQMTFFGHRFTVAGALEQTRSGIDKAVFIPFETARLMISESAAKAQQPLEIGPQEISAVLIKLKPEGAGGVPVWKAAWELEQGVYDISIVQPADLVKKMQTSLESTLTVLRSASYITWPITALLIGLVFTMAVNERRREIGLLRAMGAHRWFIFRMITLEAVLVATAGALAGIGFAAGFVNWFARQTAPAGATLPMPAGSEIFEIILISTAVALLTGIVSVVLPALQASMREPYESMRRVD